MKIRSMRVHNVSSKLLPPFRRSSNTSSINSLIRQIRPFYSSCILTLTIFVTLINSTTSTSPSIAPLKAQQLGVPICFDNSDCVVGGVCMRDFLGVGRCMCSSSCPLNVPVQCIPEKNLSCVTMGEAYMRKYDLHQPVCHQRRCICPPIFDPIPVQPPIAGFKSMLPMKCDKHDLNAMILASPSDSSYKGTMTTIFCCVNLDPRGYIAENGVYFVQNGTRKREATSSPYDNFSRDIDTLFTVPTCWSLTINNVQTSDSGTYTCIVQPMNAKFRTVNTTMEFGVKSLRRERRQKIQVFRSKPPRTIHNITISPNSTSTTLKWDMDEGPMLKIDLELFRRTDRKTRVWRKSNAKSPVLIENLNPATPYTLFISVIDGQADPFKLTEQFQTNEGVPDPPDLEDIRLINGENGRSQMCEVEWKPPRWARGHITRYFVQIKGHVRYTSPNNEIIVSDDTPQGIEMCSNFDGNEFNSIDPQMFHNFYACKYGPLKPNRNYTATIWAENKAGRSKPVSYQRQCVMDFAEPENIEPPETASRTNTSSFGLKFTKMPDEINGPIACYYLAIVPLPANASVNNLPSPELIVMDTYDKALQNNLHSSAAENNRYFAYIAESYLEYPKETIVGDGDPRGAGIEPCNVLYLTRYKPNDAALAFDLKYTGFLIARVDRDRGLQHQTQMTGDPRRFRPIITSGSVKLPDPMARTMSSTSSSNYNNAGRPRRTEFAASINALLLNNTNYNNQPRPKRQLLTSADPAYGFSNYFKPVILQPHDTSSSWIEILLLVLMLVVLITILGTTVVYFLHKFPPKIHIFMSNVGKSDHNLVKQSFHPIPIDDLPSEYVIRHKDSDFLFNAEFDSLPRAKILQHVNSEKPENLRKNRYNDIKACDETRVKLSELNNNPSSDYINANFIKGYNNQKTFIATQGPLESTIPDFWRMVYEQRCKIIIMVTNLRERGREQCSKYWPDEEDVDPIVVGNMFEVHNVESAYHADYTVREFVIRPVSTSPPPPSHSKSPSRETQPASSPLLMPGNSNYSRASFSVESPRRTPTSRGANRSESMSSPSPRPENDYANLPRTGRPVSSHSHNSHRSPNSREATRVTQYHFTSWNDYKAPECTVGLLRLMSKLRKMDDYNLFPVIVHCSAGVGRTGTWCAIDYVLDQLENEGKADVYGCVCNLRRQRNLMVQSLEQYVFIYKALAEHHLFGNTDMTIEEFRYHYQRLKDPGRRERHLSLSATTSNSTNLDEKCNGNGVLAKSVPNDFQSSTHKLKNMRGTQSQDNPRQSPLELEFNKLALSLEKPRSQQWAHKDENANRNRFDDVVPFDFNRVVLNPLIDYDNTYINASLVKGYFYPFILAQDPMGPESAFDFWRMIHDQNCYTVIMLSNEENFTPSEKYWPIDSSVNEYLGQKQELVLQLVLEEKYSNFIARKLHYCFKNADSSHGREVVQYVVKRWPSGSALPSDINAFLDLIGHVLHRQSNILDAGPIILHCRNGSTEAAIFCCVSLLLERLKSEKMIDVFNTVKTLQLQRPMLITKMEQYAFCYDAIMEYLNTSTF